MVHRMHSDVNTFMKKTDAMEMMVEAMHQLLSLFKYQKQNPKLFHSWLKDNMHTFLRSLPLKYYDLADHFNFFVCILQDSKYQSAKVL